MSSTPPRALRKMRHNNAARSAPGGINGPDECQRCDGTGDRFGRRGSFPPSQRCLDCDGRGVATSGRQND